VTGSPPRQASGAAATGQEKARLRQISAQQVIQAQAGVAPQTADLPITDPQQPGDLSGQVERLPAGLLGRELEEVGGRGWADRVQRPGEAKQRVL
jgi:hypothetical protein